MTNQATSDDTAQRGELAIPSYRLLDAAQLDLIHQATLRLLATTGVRIAHAEARDLLAGAGCRVLRDDIMLIPSGIVEASLRSAPHAITIFNRKGQAAMQLEGRNSYFGLGTDLLRTEDLETGQRRPSRLPDVINAARIADACANIDFIASFALPTEVPTNAMYVHCARAQMENSTKPIFFTAAGREDLARIIEMAEAVAGGADALHARPFIINYSEPTPPLTHSFGAVSKLFLCAEKGVPVCYTPAAMLGGSAPVTLAAALVQTNAEALSGLVMHQLRRPGAPIISGVALPPLDMRTSCVSYAAPEMRLGNSAFADLYHHYGLPMWSSAGSDAHTFDAQGALENGLGILLAALDGANLIHDVAYLGQGLLGNPAAIVMCDEIIGYAKRLLRGFSLTSEALGEEVIAAVGPGGNYLSAPHTVRHFRRDVWQPALLNRDGPDSWEERGGCTYQARVLTRARELAATHEPEPLPPATLRALHEIMARAEEQLADFEFVA
jgi:trimethylamine--corrinoid protein Co-methyltransferase